MNNDLISREALKKEVERFKETGYDTNNEPLFDYIELSTLFKIIDNAPTVEPFEPDYVGAERLKARQRGYEEGYHNGMKIGKTLNPKIKQGEWIDERNEGGGCVAICSNCKTLEVTGRFCRTCGSDNTQSFLKSFNCGADIGGDTV